MENISNSAIGKLQVHMKKSTIKTKKLIQSQNTVQVLLIANKIYPKWKKNIHHYFINKINIDNSNKISKTFSAHTLLKFFRNATCKSINKEKQYKALNLNVCEQRIDFTIFGQNLMVYSKIHLFLKLYFQFTYRRCLKMKYDAGKFKLTFKNCYVRKIHNEKVYTILWHVFINKK